MLVSASSALLVAVLVAPPLLGNTPVEVAAVSILFCGLYICITAFFGHQQGLRLAQVRQEIAREQERPRGSRATWPSTCRRRSGK